MIHKLEKNYSITLLPRLRDSQILLYDPYAGMSHPYPLTETDVLVGDVLSVNPWISYSLRTVFLLTNKTGENPRHDKVERIEWMVLPPMI